LNASHSADRKIEHLQAFVLRHVEPVQERWTLVVDTISAAGPHLVSAVKWAGLDSLASETQGGLDRILGLAGRVTTVFQNTTQFIQRMGSRSEEEERFLIDELNTTIDHGLQASGAFADEFVQLVQKTLAGVLGRMGITLVASENPEGVSATFQALLQQASTTVSKVSSAVSDYLTGTYEAAKIVLSPVDRSSAVVGARSLAGLAVAATAFGTGFN